MMEDDKRVLRKRAAFFSAVAGHLCYVHVGGEQQQRPRMVVDNASENCKFCT